LEILGESLNKEEFFGFDTLPNSLFLIPFQNEKPLAYQYAPGLKLVKSPTLTGFPVSILFRAAIPIKMAMEPSRLLAACL
jgi:hypothetical protein